LCYLQLKMQRNKNYSLWLVPKGKVYNQLYRLIKKLAKKYRAPVFEPHVTLIPDIVSSEKEILSKTAKLVQSFKPFKIKLSYVDYLNEYFRCLFIRALKIKELMDFNLRAREIFGKEDDPGFMPHLSLMYGDFNKTVKEDIIRDIGKNFNLNFTVKSVSIFLTEGEVETWYKIKEFRLLSL
jgi:2'-5' RNA ligase